MKDQENEILKTGRIIKGIGGFYTVLDEGGDAYVCKARGLFRKQGVTPLIGDTVEFALNSSSERMDGRAAEGARASGYLVGILPRRNELIRPAVANIDRLFIVIAASRPEPDLMLVDKLLLLCEKFNIEPILVINKCDEADSADIEKLIEEYRRTDYPLFAVSAETGEGLDELKKRLEGRIICMAGQSAVGKSSLLNALVPGIKLAVGGLSEKTERGRHTTRHTELIPLPKNGGAVLDTPGFSFLDTLELDEAEIRLLYPELRGREEDCRFNGCLHITEPGCAVKNALKNGETIINKNRYDRYARLVNEAAERRKHKYD